MELYDEYGVLLKVGQSVVVARTAHIVLKGVVKEIDVLRKRALVEVLWPVGNTQLWMCTNYSRRDEKICMSEIVVL